MAATKRSEDSVAGARGGEVPGTAPGEGEDEAEGKGPLRRCLVTREVRPKAELLRFVVGPEDHLLPDPAERLPGRGLWLTPRRDIVAAAAAKGLFAKAAGRRVVLPSDLAGEVERLLRGRCLALLGLARRAGQLRTGFEKVREDLKAGRPSSAPSRAPGQRSPCSTAPSCRRRWAGRRSCMPWLPRAAWLNDCGVSWSDCKACRRRVRNAANGDMRRNDDEQRG